MTSKTNSHLRNNNKTPNRKLRKRIKILLLTFSVALIAVGSYGIYLFMKAGSAMDEAYVEDEREKSELRDDSVDPKQDNVSILIMGVDQNESREQKHGDSRTDALILATLNKENKSIKLLSIPRDSYVYIPEVGYYDKINHAHAFGGTHATIETVESLFEIPIDYYVKLNFHAFVEVIDAIGGIEVDVPYEVSESDSNDKRDHIHLYPGIQTLNGEEALAFARTRKKDSDVERGKRQLEIINAVINKSTSFSSIFKYDEIIEAVGDNMTTNMTFSELKSFISYATKGTNLNIEKMSLEGSSYQPENIYYYQLDEMALEETKDILKKHLDLPTFVESDIHRNEESVNNFQSAVPESYNMAN